MVAEIPFFLRFYLFINERRTERERQRHRQREKQTLCKKTNMGPDPRSPGSGPGPKAGAKLLSHPGIPYYSTILRTHLIRHQFHFLGAAPYLSFSVASGSALQQILPLLWSFFTSEVSLQRICSSWWLSSPPSTHALSPDSRKSTGHFLKFFTEIQFN